MQERFGIVKDMKSDPNKYIFTEDLDYSTTPNSSIWGSGETLTLRELSHLISTGAIKGNWLHFASGDGRYNDMILESADSVIATDIDESALEKLHKLTRPTLSKKLQTQIQDITKPFPFEDEAFDGVCNTGTLHLFPEEILKSIFTEVTRVLKPGGMFIFDFATDLSRIKTDGTYTGSPNRYDKDSAKILLEKLLTKNHYSSRFLFDTVLPEKVTSSEGDYTFTCNFWLVIAQKSVEQTT